MLLQPVDIEGLSINLKADSIFHSLYVYEEKLPRWKNLDIAIVGINEYRGQNIEVINNPVAKFRKRFYELKQQKHSIKVADLGDIILGDNYLDTLDRITEVCKLLLEESVVPVLIGGSHDLDLAQFKAYEHIDNDLKLLTIDSTIDIEESGHAYDNHIRKILLHDPNFLFNYTHLGYQTYLNHPNATDLLEKMNCDHIRLGEISGNIAKCEPYLRYANMVSFDLSSIKQSDFSSSFNPQPFGISAENACQLMWYAGMSNNCNSIGIYGYNPELDGRGLGSGVLSVMIWYFIEGFYHRKKEDFNSDNYRKFIVSVEEEDITFLKDIRNEKWWVEINVDDKFEAIPCSYDDYMECTQGNIPQHIFNMRLKYL